jgi:spermidine/putrescine transport system substrate-binding protein
MTNLLVCLSIVVALTSSCVRGCREKAPLAATAEPKKINLFIWGDYTSAKIFKDFETQTGIHVVESNFSSNEELLAKLQAGADGYDLIIPSDYMVAVMVQLDLLAPLDLTAIPNAKNVDPQLLNFSFDPKNKWSLPYSWAVTGVVSKKDAPVTSYKDLFTRDDLKQRFSLLDDTREVMASVLKSSGYSANSTDPKQLDLARAALMDIKKRVREFNSTPASQLEHGDLIAAQMYSNEALRLMNRDSHFVFNLPSDGFTMAIDNMAIPKNSRNRPLAQVLMNYLLNPEVNLEFSTELLASPVISGVRDRLPPKLRDHPAMGRIEVVRQKSEMILDLGAATSRYDRIWTEVKASSL